MLILGLPTTTGSLTSKGNNQLGIINFARMGDGPDEPPSEGAEREGVLFRWAHMRTQENQIDVLATGRWTLILREEKNAPSTLVCPKTGREKQILEKRFW